MELAEAFARRRTVRRFDPDRPVPPPTLDRLLDRARRTPTAGFTQGVSFLLLTGDADRDRFWALTASGDTSWLRGMRTAPALVLLWTSEQAYADRYAEPDKAGTPTAAPWWWVDAGMAALALLVGAVDEGLGAAFVGVPPDRQPAVRTAFGVPAEQLSVGLVALGTPAEPPSTPRRPRRPADAVIHRGRWS